MLKNSEILSYKDELKIRNNPATKIMFKNLLQSNATSFQCKSEVKKERNIKEKIEMAKHELAMHNEIFAEGIDEYEVLNQLKKYDPLRSTSITIKDVEIKELSLTMKNELEKFRLVDTLTLTNLSLKNVNNFPKLPNLEILSLKKNCITDESLVEIIELYPNLVELDLRDNRIKCQKHIEKLEDSQIEELDLRGNFVSEKQFTHEFAFDKIKSLMIFNGKYKDGKTTKEIEFDEELEDCLSSESSISFNNPDSDSEEEEKAKDAKANYWYQPKAKRNLRYLKNVTPSEKLRIKKRKSPYFWNSEESKVRKILKEEKLEYENS